MSGIFFSLSSRLGRGRNAGVLLIGLPHLLDGPDTLDAFKMAGTETLETFRYLCALATRLWDAGNSALN